MKYVIWAAAMALFIPSPLLAQAQPAAAAEAATGPVRDSTLHGFNFFYVERQVTRETIGDTAKAEVHQVLEAMTGAHIRQCGPVVLIFRDVPTDPQGQFDLEIGVTVKQNSGAPEGYQIAQLPAANCKSVLYQGSMGTVGQAFGKLLPSLNEGAVTPTGEYRVYVLYFEDLASPNDVAMVAGVVQ
jgi:effector-binding domain-containing protein